MWIDINGYEGYYQINEDGQVKRLGTSNWSKSNVDRILKHEPNNCGYMRVTLSKCGQTKRFLVHKLVYSNFVEEIPTGLTINHKDFNKLNNNITNLEMLTSYENNQCKANTRLDKPKVQAIRKSKLSVNNLATIYKVSPRTIGHVLMGDRWANI